MVIYEDNEFLKVATFTLVIRVDSLNIIFRDIASFSKKYNLDGITNGKLYCLTFRDIHSNKFKKIETEILKAYPFKFGIDYIYFETELYEESADFGFNENANQELSHTKGLNWIKSILLPSGNYIGFTDENVSIVEQKKWLNTIIYLTRFYEDINALNPILIKKSARNFFYKISYSKYLCIVPRCVIERE